MKIRLSIDTGSGRPTPFEHQGPELHIGRDPDCELPLEGEAGSAVSRRHARIELSEAGATIADLGSSNGTLLNGQPLDEPAPLRVGDRIQMGYTGATLTVLDLDLKPPPVPAVPRAARPPSDWEQVVVEKPAPRVPLALVIGSAAGAVVLLGLAVVIALLVLRQPKPSEIVLAPMTEPQVDPRPPVHGNPSPAVSPADTGRQPPPPAREVAKGSPSEDVKEVGAYVAPEPWVSVLLRRQGEAFPWAVLRPEARVATAQTLVSLPGYRSLLALDGGLHLTLWGSLPEFSPFPPVLESVVMLHAPSAGADLDFTLDRGRVVIANRKSPAGPARVRLRFLREVWELDLPDDKSEVAVELWGELWGTPQKGAAGGPTTALSCLGLFTSGRVRVRTAGGEFEVDRHERLVWQYPQPGKPSKAPQKESPAWWTAPPDRKVPAVEKALFSLLDWSKQLGGAAVGMAPVVATIKTQVEEVRDPDNQDVGVFFLAALDEVKPLVDCLRDRQNPNVRGAAVFALQSWLSRGGQHAAELADILDKGGAGRDKAELIVSLFRFYTPEARGRPETYRAIVDLLDDENMLVRVLAFWQLDGLGAGGRLPDAAKAIEYDPAWDAPKRHSAVEQWKKLVADGKLPARR